MTRPPDTPPPAVDVAAIRARCIQHEFDVYALLAALDQRQREIEELRQELVDSEGYRQQCAEEHAADLAAAQAALEIAEATRPKT